MSNDHNRIADLIAQGRDEEATPMIMDCLDHNPDDTVALFQLGVLLLKDHRKGLAYNLYARACKIDPHRSELWLNYARSHQDVPEKWGRTEWCLNKSIKLAKKTGKSTAAALANLAMLHYIEGDLESAQEEILEALRDDSENQNALVTQGFIHLAGGEWSKAWSLYDVMLKTGKREQYCYGDEPEWYGEKSKRIIISGEQGVGDEIMYASCFDEVIDDCESVVIECMPQLKNLFQRSFPRAKVYGTRWDKEVFWDEDHNPQAHVAMASIPRFYRGSDKSFPGNPYLTPDSNMCAAVRGVLNSGDGRLKIGVAWTGGSQRTRGYLRTRTLEELTPLLRQDADFISLEYHDRSEEIEEYSQKRKISIVQLPWLTKKGSDYDLMAALVSELDLVISVPTTVTQLAGSLGVPCWVMVPKYTGWIFAQDKYVWAKSVLPFRNPSMKDMALNLENWMANRKHKQLLGAVG